MLSEHEFITAVRDEIYPAVRSVENSCLKLFNRQFSPGRGPTGLIGMNDIDETIQLLGSSIAFLRRLAKDHAIKLVRFGEEV